MLSTIFPKKELYNSLNQMLVMTASFIYKKEGVTVTFEETGKIHTNQEGKDCKVLRLRKNTRNYYILEEV